MKEIHGYLLGIITIGREEGHVGEGAWGGVGVEVVVDGVEGVQFVQFVAPFCAVVDTSAVA